MLVYKKHSFVILLYSCNVLKQSPSCILIHFYVWENITDSPSLRGKSQRWIFNLLRLCESTWIKNGSLPCWQPRGQSTVTQELNLRSPLHTGYKQVTYPGLETQDRHHQKSKTGISVAPQKTDVLQFFLRKIKQK